LSSKLSVKMW